MGDSAGTKRRGRGEGSIYQDTANRCWVGSVSMYVNNRRVRRTVRGATKTAVRNELRKLLDDTAIGIKPDGSYTVERAIDDWLSEGLDGRSAATVRLYADLLKPMRESIGAVQLRKLSSHDVRAALAKLTPDHSTRTIRLTHNVLTRAIRHAEANDHVGRNVAAIATVPTGRQGRPSKALTADQAATVLKAAKDSRLHAYVVVSLTTGARTEELRALRWDHVDLDGKPDAVPPIPPSIAVWRAERHGGDTKTRKSRRTLKLPQIAVQALRDQLVRQADERLYAGIAWQDHGLTFASTVGTPLDASHVRRAFKSITEAAGIGRDWTPRELRHSFVSLLSESGTPIEEIARLVGHTDTRTTETIYRQELRPVLTRGAEVMDSIFS